MYFVQIKILAVMMVDEDKMRRDAQLQSQAQWTTKGGFVYPAPKPPEEFARHSKPVDASRREDLRVPWVENELHPKPVARAGY